MTKDLIYDKHDEGLNINGANTIVQAHALAYVCVIVSTTFLSTPISGAVS